MCIELREVERAVEDHPEVNERAVVAVPGRVAGTLLAAFVVGRDGFYRQQLVSFCASRLPAYMIPAHVGIVPELPRTSTNKVDRQALVARRIGRGQEQFPLQEVEQLRSRTMKSRRRSPRRSARTTAISAFNSTCRFGATARPRPSRRRTPSSTTIYSSGSARQSEPDE